MSTQSKLVQWSGITAVLVSLITLLGPAITVYSVKMFAGACLLPMLAISVLVWLYTQGKVQLPSKMALGITVIGATLWEVGWVIMTLFSADAGWAIFMAGWLVLSLGLLLMGIVTIQQKALPHWYALLLVVGLWPALAELANPQLFVNHLATPGQVAVMVFYGLGWTMLGYVLRETRVSVAALQTQRI